jgi:hypothetical protein
LVAAVPVSLRQEGDDRSNNQASMTVVTLATNVADPRRRFLAQLKSSAAMKQSLSRWKSLMPTDFPSMGLPWLMSRAARLYGRTRLAERIPVIANLVISNVPGPQFPLYLAGARMERYNPTSIVVHGLALNITIQSYDGKLEFGLVGCARAVTEPSPNSRATSRTNSSGWSRRWPSPSPRRRPTTPRRSCRVAASPDPPTPGESPPAGAARPATTSNDPRVPMPDFSSLQRYRDLNVPVWVHDPHRHRQVWANDAALKFWRADSLDELRARSYEDMSEGALSRLALAMRAHERGETTRERWTLYPRGLPEAVQLHGSGFALPDGGQGILFIAEPPDLHDPALLRGVEALLHTPMLVSMHRMDTGSALMRNPAAALALGPIEDNRCFLASFEDQGLAQSVLDSVRQGQSRSLECRLQTRTGPPGTSSTCVRPGIRYRGSGRCSSMPTTSAS